MSEPIELERWAMVGVEGSGNVLDTLRVLVESV